MTPDNTLKSAQRAEAKAHRLAVVCCIECDGNEEHAERLDKYAEAVRSTERARAAALRTAASR